MSPAGLLLLAAAAAAPADARAQLPASRLFALEPAGGRRGETLEVAVRGADLDEAQALLFSHPGIRAELRTEPPGPFDQEPKPLYGRFLVTIDPGVPRGIYEAWVAGRFGLSNPRAFEVGEVPETIEKEGNNTPQEAGGAVQPVTVNGRIDGATDVDCFRFRGRKGERLLIDCKAERIDSRLDPVVALLGPDGVQVDRAVHTLGRDALLDVTLPAEGEYTAVVHDLTYRGGPEYFYRLTIGDLPHLDYVFPPAGLPGMRGRFELYGRNLPGGQAAPDLAVEGRPLERLEATIDLPWEPVARELRFPGFLPARSLALDGMAYRLETGPYASNPVLLTFSPVPVVSENEPNNDSAARREIPVPCEVAGRFYPREDIDRFRFRARKGDTYAIEIFCDRLGLIADPYLTVSQVQADGSGKESLKEIAKSDDIGGGDRLFSWRSDDAAVRFTAPADGLYEIAVHDLSGTARSDARVVYRLAVRPEMPDFRLVAVPVFPPLEPDPNKNAPNIWSPLLRRGGAVFFQVYALRRDGFNLPIRVRAEGLPAGVESPGAVIEAGGTACSLVLSARADAPAWIGFVRVVGEAETPAGPLVREARAGVTVWAGQQAEAPRFRIASALPLAVSEEPAPLAVRIAAGAPLTLPLGAKVKLPVKLERRGFKGDVTVFPLELPPKVGVKNLTLKGEAAAGEIEVEVKPDAPVGDFVLSLVARAQIQYRRNPEAAERAQARKAELEATLAALEEEVKKSAAALAEAEKTLAQRTKERDERKVALDEKAKLLAQAEAAVRSAKEKLDAAKGSEGDNAKEAAAAMEKAAAELERIRAEAAEAEKALAAAEAALKEAGEAKAAAEKKLAEVTGRRDQAKAVLSEVAKEAEALAKAAQPKKAKVAEPSNAVRVRILSSPVRLLPGTSRLNLKAGAKAELSLKVERLGGYDGPVKIRLEPPKEAQGLKAAEVEVAKGASEAKLVLEAGVKARAGLYTVPVKALVKFAGQDRVTELRVLVEVRP